MPILVGGDGLVDNVVGDACGGGSMDLEDRDTCGGGGGLVDGATGDASG